MKWDSVQDRALSYGIFEWRQIQYEEVLILFLHFGFWLYNWQHWMSFTESAKENFKFHEKLTTFSWVKTSIFVRHCWKTRVFANEVRHSWCRVHILKIFNWNLYVKVNCILALKYKKKCQKNEIMKKIICHRVRFVRSVRDFQLMKFIFEMHVENLEQNFDLNYILFNFYFILIILLEENNS